MSTQFVYNRRNEEYWIATGGVKLLPSQMEDEHLINTIAYLERNAEAFKQLHNLTILRKPKPCDLNGQFDQLKEIKAAIDMPARKWMRRDFFIYRDMKVEYHERVRIRTERYATDLRHIESLHNWVQYHISNNSSEEDILRAMSQVSNQVAASVEPESELDPIVMRASAYFGVSYRHVTPEQCAIVEQKYGRAHRYLSSSHDDPDDFPEYYRS